MAEITTQTLNLLYEQKNVTWWSIIAEHKHCPSSLLQKLLNSAVDDSLLRGLAKNPNCDGKTLKTLYKNNQTTYTIKNPSCPPELLEEAALNPALRVNLVF